MRVLHSYGPASIGNLITGFDILGVAVQLENGGLWGDVLTLALAETDSLEVVGPYSSRVPADPSHNLVTITQREFTKITGITPPHMAIRLRKGLPVASGLGSSSASVVATVMGLNHFLKCDLPLDVLLKISGEAERSTSGAFHLDNAAPALLGGVRLIDPHNNAHLLPFPEDLRFVVTSPDFSLATWASRRVLPKSVPFNIAVTHSQNLSSLIAALYQNDRDLMRLALKDKLVEVHRAPLVTGFRAVQHAAMEAGAIGCSLAGAGPAVLAICDHIQIPVVQKAMEDAFLYSGVNSVSHVCLVDPRGARILEESELP